MLADGYVMLWARDVVPWRPARLTVQLTPRYGKTRMGWRREQLPATLLPVNIT